MEDFASYSEDKKPQAPKEAFDFEKEIKRAALRYNGRGEGEIIKEIFARAAEGKRNGTLTNEQIDLFFEQFSKMLDSAKKKRLQKLVNQLKEM